MTAWRVHTAALFYNLLASLPDIDLFLDVGSLDGREAFAAERYFPRVRCIAIEPNPRNIEVIRAEIVRRHSRIDLETFAVGNENGTTSFYARTPVSSNNYGASSILQFSKEAHNNQFVTSTIQVPIRRLDSIDAFYSYEKIALWIDVEGAGYHVLEGISGIAQKVQMVHIEAETKSLFHGEKLASDIIHIMSSYGFDLIGSNLDRSFHRPQGDMVFLRKHALSGARVKQATLGAWVVEHVAMQRLARRVLPMKVYRLGRDWLIQTVVSKGRAFPNQAQALDRVG
jgi:FkbM family methyltransferase